MHAEFLSYTIAYIRPYIQTIKHSLLKILDTDHNQYNDRQGGRAHAISFLKPEKGGFSGEIIHSVSC